MDFRGVNISKQTRNSRVIDKIYIEQVENGSPVLCHVPAYIDLMWKDLWLSQGLSEHYSTTLDAIGELLARS